MLSTMSRRQATKMSSVPSQPLETPEPQSIQEEALLCLKAASGSSFAAEQERDALSMENLTKDKGQDAKVIQDKPTLELPKDIETRASLREAGLEDLAMEVQESPASNEPMETTATESVLDKSQDQTDPGNVVHQTELEPPPITTPPQAPVVTAVPLSSPPSFNSAGRPAHGCTCGRIFDTQRGRSMHWSHEPEHRRLWYERAKSLSLATSPSDGQQPSLGSEALSSAHSEPTSPYPPPSSPPHSPTSTPASPMYDMSAFKTSARNPQYYSIIRTRRSSNVDAVVETGSKRSRNVADTASGSSPPTKALHLDTGERVATAESEKEASVSGSPQKRKLEQKGTIHRPRTRSLSSSDNVSPSVKNSPGTAAAGADGNSKSSPVTRSSSASMKTHEFISLPTRRRRGGKGRGRRGGTDTSMETDDIDSPMQIKPSEEEKKQVEEPPPNPQPVKRKRGRPPKNRPKDQSIPTLTSSHSAPSSVKVGRPSRASARSGEASNSKEENTGEDPLPQGSESMKLPLWDTFGGESAEGSKEKNSSGNIPSLLPKVYPKKDPASPTTGQPQTIPLSPTQITSSQCSYVVTSKESGKSTETSTAIVSEGGSSSRRNKRVSSDHDSEVGNKRKGSRRSSNVIATSKEEESEVFEVADSTKNVEIDLTGESDSTQVYNTRKVRSKSKGSKSRSDKSTSSSKDGEDVEESKKEEEMEKTLEETDGEHSTSRRSSSVIVNTASSKSQSKQEDQSNGSSSSSSEPKQPLENMDASLHRQAMNEPVVLPYPPSSATTPTYPPYPYHGPYPPPPPIMYPGPPSSIYPPYYSYPGVPVTQPLPPHGHYIGMPPGMMPPPISNATAEQQSLTSPHSNMPAPSFPQFSGGPVVSTVSGVKVSVIDKPPSQMPTANIPHHTTANAVAASGATQPRAQSSSYPMDAQNAAMGQLVRPYMGGAHSPDTPPGMDMSRQLHPHPLSQTYRPGMMGLPTPSYPPYHHHVALRLDPSGMPYMDWVHETKPPPPEEQPAQPVECPECGRMFKNNKALNGHMRLHGGFDWTKKPFVALENKHKDSSTSASSETSTGEDGNSEADKKSSEKKSSNSNKKRSGSGSNSRSRSKSPAPGSDSKSKKRRRSSEDTNPLVREVKKEPVSSSPLPVPRAPSVFTFDTKVDHKHISSSMQDAGTMTQPTTSRNATLDDLCRAVEELERIENRGNKWKSGGEGSVAHSRSMDSDEFGRKRPQDIVIPSHSSPALERHRLGNTPPYTPPPILSPARSMTMIATAAQPGTPSRILHPWSSRRSSDGRKPSESDESYAEPKINVGKEFQAILPEFSESHAKTSQDEHRATKVWQPIKDLSVEDDSVIDGYLELACSPATPCAGRNKELALHFLFQLGGSVKEAVRLLLSGKSVFNANHPMATYNYSGSKKWSAKERQQFRRAWRVHRKQFPLLRSAVETKTLTEVIEYYYSWKKYCSDEYRGRNRHLSEEILGSDEEDAYPEIPSSSSSASADNDTPPMPSDSVTNKPNGDHEKHTKTHREDKQHRVEKPSKHYHHPGMDQPQVFSQLPHPQPPRFSLPHMPPAHMADGPGMYEHLPIVYAPHTAHPPQGQPVHQYKCKYPGCNQVFTSIFALNGHIRVHGGSFYPRPQSSSSHSHGGGSSSTTSSSHSQPTHAHVGTSTIPSSSHRPHSHSYKVNPGTDYQNQQKLELAKALLELPQPRSPARSGGYHTPSPKPSPAKSRSPATKKKVVGSSSSPGEREGYYPCNRCGRVFTKVKSRSAHMKSHIIKQN